MELSIHIGAFLDDLSFFVDHSSLAIRYAEENLAHILRAVSKVFFDVSDDHPIPVISSLLRSVPPPLDTFSLSDVILKSALELGPIWKNDNSTPISLIILKLTHIPPPIRPSELSSTFF